MKKTLVLAGLMWLAVFLIPFLKYPANPPTVGDADTVVLRSILYLSFIAISGFSLVGFYKLSKIVKNKTIPVIGYAAFITLVFFSMPENPDENNAPVDLVDGFRVMSVIAVSIFWVSLAIILGSLWEKFQPHNTANPKL